MAAGTVYEKPGHHTYIVVAVCHCANPHALRYSITSPDPDWPNKPSICPVLRGEHERVHHGSLVSSVYGGLVSIASLEADIARGRYTLYAPIADIVVQRILAKIPENIDCTDNAKDFIRGYCSHG